MKIEVIVQVDTVGDPPIKIYHIDIVDKESESVWEEIFGTKEQAEVFLKGARAAFSFTNLNLNIPSIPE